MIDLKKLCDFENNIKEDIKQLHLKKEEVYNSYESGIKNNKNKFLVDFIIIVLNLLFFNSLSIFFIVLYTMSIIGVHNNNIYLKNEKLLFDIEYNELIKKLDGTIDSCELLKDFIRKRDLSKEDLVKIVTYLYSTFKNEINEVIYELEKKCNHEFKIYNEFGNEIIISKEIEESINYEDNFDNNIESGYTRSRVLKR